MFFCVSFVQVIKVWAKTLMKMHSTMLFSQQQSQVKQSKNRKVVFLARQIYLFIFLFVC